MFGSAAAAAGSAASTIRLSTNDNNATHNNQSSSLRAETATAAATTTTAATAATAATATATINKDPSILLPISGGGSGGSSSSKYDDDEEEGDNDSMIGHSDKENSPGDYYYDYDNNEADPAVLSLMTMADFSDYRERAKIDFVVRKPSSHLKKKKQQPSKIHFSVRKRAQQQLKQERLWAAAAARADRMEIDYNFHVAEQQREREHERERYNAWFGRGGDDVEMDNKEHDYLYHDYPQYYCFQSRQR